MLATVLIYNQLLFILLSPFLHSIGVLLAVRRALEQVQVRQVHVEGGVGLHLVEHCLGCELSKVRHVDQTDLAVAERLQ